MIAIEERPSVNLHIAAKAELRVEPKDISFHDLPGDRVRIEITVHNEGAGSSRPTSIRLESAPLGAFVPWQPLTTLSVPSIEPGESRQLSTVVARPRPTPLGDFNRVPPKKVLTGVNSPDQPAPQPAAAGLMSMLRLLRKGQSARNVPGRGDVDTTSLAPDLWDLLGRGQPYWAGNINVFIGSHPVERHVAKALRIYPGRTNLAMFVVGGPRSRDAYSFELVGLSSDWKAALHDVTNSKTLLVDPSHDPIQETDWVESDAGLMVMLATQPPADCKKGNVQVHVTRRSCGTTAVVEFDLDPKVQGSGCYFV